MMQHGLFYIPFFGVKVLTPGMGYFTFSILFKTSFQFSIAPIPEKLTDYM
jgi:hypothetical protein